MCEYSRIYSYNANIIDLNLFACFCQTQKVEVLWRFLYKSRRSFSVFDTSIYLYFSYSADTSDIYGNAAGTSCRTKIWSNEASCDV